MARETEELLIALRADLNQFEKAFAKAHGISTGQLRKIQREVEGKANAIERRMGAMGASIKGSLLAAFTVGGFTALFNGVSEAIQKIADLAETAEKAGVSVEQLQQLTFAGKAAGLGSEQLVTGLQRLNRELAKAKEKGAEVGTTFEEFLKLADNVSAAETAVEKTGIAVEKLGKGGAQFLPLLNQGAAQLTKQFGQATLASNELAKAADEFYDKWALGLTNWQTLFNSTISQILVSLDVLTTRTGDLTKAQLEFRRAELLGLLKTLEEPGLLGIGPTINSFGIANARAELDDIEERLRIMSRIPKPPLLQTGDGPDDTETESAAKTAEKIADRIGDMTTEIEKMPAAIPAMTEMKETLIEIQEGFKDAFGDLVVAAGDGKLKVEELMNTLNSLRDRLLRLAAEKIFDIIFGNLQTGSPGLINSIPLPGRASGGHVNAGQAYKVGERGAEMFVPKQSGTIIPNSKLGGSSGRTVINNFGPPVSAAESGGINGQDLILTIEAVQRRDFVNNLNRFAPAIGARPASKRIG